ncbi:DUF2341 domain-containing protein, partial [Candidatus Woesearchaeota archaeon]|nr:DUF2341 domain-containing protein [Candidatus Woesearchaeota archaeon]
MMRLKVHIGAICIFLALFLTSQSAFAENSANTTVNSTFSIPEPSYILTADKSAYTLGELVLLNITYRSGFGLLILTDNVSYHYLSPSSLTLFKPQSTGNYTAALINASEQIANATFSVSYPPAALWTDKSEYAVDEEVQIFLYPNNTKYELSIEHENETYLFIELQKYPVNFYPRKEGEYSISALVENATLTANFTVMKQVYAAINITSTYLAGDELTFQISNISLPFSVIVETPQGTQNYLGIAEPLFIFIPEEKGNYTFSFYENSTLIKSVPVEIIQAEEAVIDTFALSQDIKLLINFSEFAEEHQSFIQRLLGLSSITQVSAYVEGRRDDENFRIGLTPAGAFAFSLTLFSDPEIEEGKYTIVVQILSGEDSINQTYTFLWLREKITEEKASVYDYVSHSFAINETAVLPVNFTEEIQTPQSLIDRLLRRSRISTLILYVEGQEENALFAPSAEHIGFDDFIVSIPSSEGINPDVYTLAATASLKGETYTKKEVFNWGLTNLTEIAEKVSAPEARLAIVDKYGQPISHSEWRKSGGNITTLEIAFTDQPISSLTTSYVYFRGGLISIAAEITPPMHVEVKKAYAMSPSFSFMDLTITAMAEGTLLYRCEGYNITADYCAEWKIEKNLTKGGPYTAEITGTTAFAEAVPALPTAITGLATAEIEEEPEPVLSLYAEYSSRVSPSQIVPFTITIISDGRVKAQITEELPEAWSAQSLPPNTTLAGNLIATNISAESGITLITYELVSPPSAGTGEIKTKLVYSAGELQQASRILVDAENSPFETKAEITYSGRQLEAGKEYAIAFSITNKGKAVSEYPVILTWPYDASIISVGGTSGCGNNELLDYGELSALQCSWQPFGAGETKTVEALITPLKPGVHSTPINVTYDPPKLKLSSIRKAPYMVLLKAETYKQGLLLEVWHEDNATHKVEVSDDVSALLSREEIGKDEHASILIENYNGEYFTITVGEEVMAFGESPVQFAAQDEAEESILAKLLSAVRDFFSITGNLIASIFGETGAVVTEPPEELPAPEPEEEPAAPPEVDEANATAEEEPVETVEEEPVEQPAEEQPEPQPEAEPEPEPEEKESLGGSSERHNEPEPEPEPAAAPEPLIKEWFPTIKAFTLLIEGDYVAEIIPVEVEDSEKKKVELDKRVLKVKKKDSEKTVVDLEVKVKKKDEIVLEFMNLTVKNDTVPSFRVEQLDDAKVRETNTSFVKLYSIDTEQLNFTSAEVTLTATGRALQKCAEWDFEQQICLGTWVKIMDLTPGQEYTFTLTPGDPGYAETGVASINTNKSIYHLGEEVNLIAVVLDTSGHLVSGADVVINVTSPSGLTETFTTPYNIIETERGIYEATYESTAENGTYVIKVTALGNNVNSTLTSYFAVQYYYEFDILRSTPVTTDPWQGAFESSITLISLTDAATFDFSEVLPINFTVTDAGGAAVTEQGDKKILTWSSLANNSVVSYSALPPLVTPDLYEVGPSYITYGSQTFAEARPWYLAVDPVINITVCQGQDSETSQDSFPDSCDGSYPGACGSADRLSCNDGVYETHTTGSNNQYGGVRISSYNSSITDCTGITQVQLCYEWWTSGWMDNWQVRIDNDDWASPSTVDSSDPGTSANPGVECLDVTSYEDDWTCGNFNGDGTPARAVIQAQQLYGGSRTVTIDVLYFDVTYESDNPPTVSLEFPPPSYWNDTVTPFDITFNCSIDDDNDAVNISLYITNNQNQSFTFNDTCDIPGADGSCAWPKSLNNGNYTWNCIGYDDTGQSDWGANRTIVINSSTIVPTISNTSCHDGSTWGECSALGWGDTISSVRTNCSSNNAGGSITNVTFALSNIEDDKLFFNETVTTMTGNYWEYDNADLIINDSGTFNLHVVCRENPEVEEDINWTVPWGNLTTLLISPSSNTTVLRNKFFPFTSEVSCAGGECGYVNATLDPYIGEWWDTSFAYRTELNITNPYAELADFPTYINVSYNEKMNANYTDLRFVSGSCGQAGAAALDYEIENYTSASAHVWLRIPTLEVGNNSVCMYYGNSEAGPGNNTADVWNSTYIGVWHLSESGSSHRIDSTSNGNYGTNVGASSTAGVVGGAQSFDGSSRVTVARTAVLEPSSE